MKKIAMIAVLFGFAGAVHAGLQEATNQGGIGNPQASVEQPVMVAVSTLGECQFQCDNHHDNGSSGWKGCYESCDNHFSGQASAKPETMPADSTGGAFLEPEPEYDIKLGTDPLCDTDPYSCFHFADNDATVIRTAETLGEAQQAFLIPIIIICVFYCNYNGAYDD
ncbi:hypothetical protein [Thioalkalivibrio sp. HK1]|uniref:hypothetical protein n=1 Tax=Thioalkalivibrio sp. HK1 TaxID=1469245 RepID=UPI000470E005|nr:hypothetical protein [Thioalkalivibrio sp. HK1]